MDVSLGVAVSLWVLSAAQVVMSRRSGKPGTIESHKGHEGHESRWHLQIDVRPHLSGLQARPARSAVAVALRWKVRQVLQAVKLIMSLHSALCRRTQPRAEAWRTSC